MTEFSLTILVVEDEALLLLSIAEDLRDAGFTVLEARNADEALRLLHDFPAIRVMFTDVDMPGSMDGLRLAAAVRDKWPPIKIIVTSGIPRVNAEIAFSGGIFIPKPYFASEVSAAIHSCLA